MFNTKRALLIVTSLVLTFIGLRLSLYLSPNSNFDIGAYNIHHLYTGLVLLTLAGLPLVLHSGNGRISDIAALVFGAGLSMALDEVVYLITTDGSDAAYLLPVSFWGGVLMVGLTAAYIIVLMAHSRWRERCASTGSAKRRTRPRRAMAG